MRDDLRTIILSASFGLLVAVSAIYSTGYRGQVAGFEIGPSVPWLKVAGH